MFANKLGTAHITAAHKIITKCTKTIQNGRKLVILTIKSLHEFDVHYVAKSLNCTLLIHLYQNMIPLYDCMYHIIINWIKIYFTTWSLASFKLIIYTTSSSPHYINNCIITVAPFNLTWHGWYLCSSRGNTDCNRICICMGATDDMGLWQKSRVTYHMKVAHTYVNLISLVDDFKNPIENNSTLRGCASLPILWICMR